MARILLIEDDEHIRTLIRDVLESSGHDVIECANGEEGLYAYELSSPSLVITDILMPDKEGLETIRDMRHKRPDVKIIAISGGLQSIGVDVLDLARKFGASCTIEKPFEMSELLRAVEDMLHQKP